MALHKTVGIFWSLMMTHLKTVSAVLKATNLKIFYKRNIRIVTCINFLLYHSIEEQKA